MAGVFHSVDNAWNGLLGMVAAAETVGGFKLQFDRCLEAVGLEWCGSVSTIVQASWADAWCWLNG